MAIYAEDMRPIGTQYTDSVAKLNPTSMSTNSDLSTLPWSTIQHVQWINPVPTGKRLARYNGQLVLVTGY